MTHVYSSSCEITQLTVTGEKGSEQYCVCLVPATSAPPLKEMEWYANTAITAWVSRFAPGCLIWRMVCLGTFRRQRGECCQSSAIQSLKHRERQTHGALTVAVQELQRTAVLTDGDRDDWQHTLKHDSGSLQEVSTMCSVTQCSEVDSSNRGYFTCVLVTTLLKIWSPCSPYHK